MGKKDLDLKSYFSDRRRYADIYNGSIFRGGQLLKAEELEPVETVVTKTGKEGAIERTSDIVMRQKTTGDLFALWILENQETFLDFGSEDIRLQEELKRLVPEYPLHILDLSAVTDYSKFRTELRTVFELYRYRSDKEKFKKYVAEHEECRHLDEESYRIIGRFTNAEKLLIKADKGKKEEKDMDIGSAIWDIREEGVQEGISQGMKALVETYKEFGCTKEEAVAKMMEKCTLSQSEAEKYAEEYGY